MNQIFKRLMTFWTREKSFTFLLIVLSIYIFGIIPFLSDDIPGKISFLFLYYLLLTSSMGFILNKYKTIKAFLLFALPFIFLIIEINIHSQWIQVLTDFIVAVYSIMLGSMILLRTFEKGEINVQRVQGAIIVYLLISLVFALIYHSIYILSTAKSFNGFLSTHRKEFLYFSLCTLTTDGYGDIIPVSAVARSLSNLESLVGQLYPAVLIARLVSMELNYKKKDQEPVETNVRD
jgi:hypothetical protein